MTKMTNSKTNKTMRLATALAIATAALLTACGGGGGSTATPGAANFTASCVGGGVQTSVISTADAASKCPNAGSATLVVSVPTPTYAVGSEELAAFNFLNAERLRSGFGMLGQSTQLDTAARGHADYQIVNLVAGHFQNQQVAPLGFTGVNPIDRAAAAGYNGSVIGDEIASRPGSQKNGFGIFGMRGLLSAPYHLAGLMQGWKDVGISLRTDLDTTPPGKLPFTILQVSTGVKYADSRQQLAAGTVSMYPCDGSVDVSRELRGESPNPVPGRDLAINPIGTPVYVAARYGSTLNIVSANMRETATNTPVVLRTPILAANDPNNIFGSYEGYVAPDTSLKSSTAYTVSVTGSNNGIAFAKTCSFTTGN